MKFGKPEIDPFSDKWEVKLLDDNNKETGFKDFNTEQEALAYIADETKKNKEDVTLTPEMQLIVLQTWQASNEDNPPTVQKLTDLCFGPGFDGRSVQSKLIKQFLVQKNLKVVKSEPKILALTDEQKQYIANHYNTSNSITDLAKELFGNRNLQSISPEVKLVVEYARTLVPVNVSNGTEDVALDEYKPPKTLDQALVRINKHIQPNIEKAKLNAKGQKDIWKFIGYLHTFRYLQQINTYQTQTERDLMESSFVKYTYDKPDLTQEDIDQYIILSIEVVNSVDIQRTIGNLQEEQQRTLNQENGRLATNLVELISVCRKEYNDSVKRQQSLFDALTEKRSKKLEDRVKETASLLNLVELWKREETRKQIIQVAKTQQEAVKQEIEHLSNMDEIKAKILGISEEEILNG